MRNNPISHYWLTRLLYRVQYYTIRTIPWITGKYVALFDIYFITLFFSTCQVRVKLVFRPITSFSHFTPPLLSNAAVISPGTTYLESSRFSFSATMQTSDFCCSLNVQVSLCSFASGRFSSGWTAKETFLPGGTFERYFINGEWNRQRGQKLTCYIVRAIHWTRQNTQHEPRNCIDLHSECTWAMRSPTTIVVSPGGLCYPSWKNTSASSRRRVFPR